MKFGVLALDYDGTMAEHGVLDPGVRAAIAEARERGIKVLIVTGRILSDLQQVAGDLHFIDGVVGENGATLWFPNGYSRKLTYSTSIEFLHELQRRGVPFNAGQCVVELEAGSAPKVLEIVRQLELPLVLLFNRDRLMVLPQGVTKGSGLREALTMLRLSAHNAIGIGDGENDHELLEACELGVAVEWGSRALQRAADEVIEGRGPSALAEYIRRAATELRLPPEKISQHRLRLGTADDGREVTFGIRGRNLLIAGDPRSGKSWVAGLIAEQMILEGYSLCMVDPEGDYRSLEPLPGVVLFGGDDPPPGLPDLARVLRHPKMSVLLDLSRLTYNEKMGYMRALLPMLAAIRRQTGLPHRIVIDEAHYFLHQAPGELLDLNLSAYTLLTYRMSDLHPTVRDAIDAIIINRMTEPRERESLNELLRARGCPASGADFAALEIGEAVLLPGLQQETGGECVKFKLYPRLTSHVRHKAKYLDVQFPADQGFWFTEQGRLVAGPARTLKEFLALLNKVPDSVLASHAEHEDFSCWIAGVLRDHALASAVRKIEQRFRLGHIPNVRDSIKKPIEERYVLSPALKHDFEADSNGGPAREPTEETKTAAAPLRSISVSQSR